jgi:predicted amino acid-binding ACT domain protein
LQVQVRPFRPGAGADMKDCENFVVTCFGPDTPGVICRFSSLLADKGINIVDLYGQLSGDRFVLISQVQVPRHWDLAMLQADLEQLGREQGYTVRLQHENLFIATNQLRLSRLAERKGNPDAGASPRPQQGGAKQAGAQPAPGSGAT